MDVTAIFEALQKTNGLQGVVLILLIVMALMVTGVLRPRGNVEAELAARDAAKAAEIAAKDSQVQDLMRLYDKIEERMSRQQELFDQALSLIRQEIVPLLKAALDRQAGNRS